MKSIIRDVTLKAKKNLGGDEILLFIGARQAGKTTILRQLQAYLVAQGHFVSFLNLEDPDYLGLLNESPKNLFKIFSLDLKKKNFIIIDEIQYLDNPSNFLKYFFDEYKGRLKLLVSGSSAFYIDKKFKDSLVGRKRIFNVRTLSFREFLRFKNEKDLSQKNFEVLSISEKEKVSIFFREYIVYGGYPRVALASLEEKVEVLREIAYSYVKKDIFEANIRGEEVFYRLLKILSRQIGSLVNSSELASTLGVSKTSIDNYLYVSQKSFHIHLIKPFFKNMRKELTKMPKVYFSDLGLRNFFSANFKSFETREDQGQLLENASFRQLLERHGEENIRFWRSVGGSEVDFVVNEDQAFEIKLTPEKFKISKYKTFMKNYPNTNLSIVTLEAKPLREKPLKIIEVWQI